jgi:glycosyltransferase involved in cell wall biosynthesis
MLKTTGHTGLVSVVMPSLNQARFIERAVRSVLTQRDSSVEIVIMDGGSTDGTQSLLDRLAQETGERLRWVSEADRGPAHAVNKAMAMAQGSVIGWLNADDVYTPNAIERAVQTLEKNPHWMMVYGRAQHIDESDRVIGSYPTHRPDVPMQRLADGCFICQPTVFLRKTAIMELGQLDENLKAAFDFEWWLRLFARFPGRIGFVDAVQAQSRLHEACITLDQRETVFRESMQLISRYLGVCPSHWFKTYVNEILAKYPHAPWSADLIIHVQMFADTISDCLSAADQREIREWLDLKAAKEQRHPYTIAKGLTVCRKFASTIGTILRAGKWPGRENRQIRLVKSSGLFDEAWYLSKYKDVAGAGADPVKHYLQYGACEGRDPSALFDTRAYVESNPEISKMGMNPLVHYLLYGRADADRTEH